MRRLSSVTFSRLTGGRDGAASPIDLRENQFQELVNLMVQRNSLVKRSGYSKRYASVLVGTSAPVQKAYEYLDNSQTRRWVYAIEGKLYRDDATTQTDITGSLTLSNNRDAIYHMVTYDGQIIGTDGVNTPFTIATTSSDATAMAAGQQNQIPSVVRVLAVWKEHILAADITDLDGVRYPYRVIWNSPINISDWPIDRVNDLNRGQRVVAMVTHGEYLLIFQEDQTWYVSYQPTGSAQLQSALVFQVLDPSVGAVGAKSVLSTEQGTFFLSRKGPYWIPKGELQPPIYIGKPIEDLWANLNRSRLEYACAGEIPEKNGILFCVPNTAAQTTNNMGIFANYQLWARDVEGDTHPAYSVFNGPSSQEFTFNCFGQALISGRSRCLGGGYDGFVYLMDDGYEDDGVAFECSFKTPYYNLGDPSREKKLYQAVFDVDLDNNQALSVRLRIFDVAASFTSDLTRTVGTAVLGQTFILGNMTLGGPGIGRLWGRLRGMGRYVELEGTVSTSVALFALRSIGIYFKPLGRLAA